MNSDEVQHHLSRLGLSQTEAAQLLGVAPRTIRRWLDGEEIPGPVEQAIRAWVRLAERNSPWRPDSASIVEDDQEQIAQLRTHAIGLSDLLARVEARGGARLPWIVDRERCRAILGPMEVSYYKLANGGFSLSNYTRKDGNPDVQRDREFIEDAAYCIAKEIRRTAEIPVTLVYMSGPVFRPPNVQLAQTQLIEEEFSSNEAAIHRACQLLQAHNCHSLLIREGRKTSAGETLWDEPDLLRECSRRKK